MTASEGRQRVPGSVCPVRGQEEQRGGATHFGMSHLPEGENATQQSLSFTSSQWGVTEGFQIEKGGDQIWTAREKTHQQHGGHAGEEAREDQRGGRWSHTRGTDSKRVGTRTEIKILI